MLFTSVRREILDRSREYFQRDGSGKGYICPICGSGSGKKGTGITTRDGLHFTCWTGCYTNADIFQIVGIERNLPTFNEQIEYLSDYFGLQLDRSQSSTASRAPTGAQLPELPEVDAAAAAPDPVKEKDPEIDYTPFFLQAAAGINNTDYHRGISLDTLQRFNVGFVPNWRHPKAPETVPTSPRLIIPTSKHGYLARDTRPPETIPESAKDYKKSKVGKQAIFNADALAAASKPIFIVEGEIDAMSIEDIGGHAVGMGSIAYSNMLIEAIQKAAEQRKAAGRPFPPFIIALDNEEKAQNVARNIAETLHKMGIAAEVKPDIWQPHKDPNDFLMTGLSHEREQLQKRIQRQEAAAEGSGEADYFSTYADTGTENLLSWIFSQGTERIYTPTGFTELDRILNGGLYNEKLYAIGAISSLGKTTLAMQIADNIARSGRDVLIFSLEMSERELIGRSVSRLTYEITQRSKLPAGYAKTDTGIMLYEKWANYTGQEMELIEKAVFEHRDTIGHNKKILSSADGYTVNDIDAAITKHISITGRKPVVFVDYLQIIRAAGNGMTDKQKIDNDVSTLKRAAVKHNVPIMVISSFNRDNYQNKASFAAFKESGSIEYSVDVCIGLQLAGVGKKDFDVDAAKAAEPREIELIVLKQRQGKTGIKIGYDYIPRFNHFAETGIIENKYKDTQSDSSSSSTAPEISKKDFEKKWNAIEEEQRNNNFSLEWRVQRERALLSMLEHGSNLYMRYYRKFKTDEEKAEKEAGTQQQLPDDSSTED